MKFTAEQLAEYLKGKICGNKDVSVSSISKIEEGKEGTLSFLANPKYTQYIYTTKASIVLVKKDFTPEKDIQATLIKVEDPYLAFASLLKLYEEYKSPKPGIDTQTSIDKTANIGDNAYIGAFTYIGKNVKIGKNAKIFPQVFIGDNTVIGENCTIRAGVKIYEDTIIGNNCIFHSGVIIGGDGFGFVPQSDNYEKIPQIGNVIIEDNVEIGANTTVDRATIGSTIIRKGVKLDNQIQIGHNVEVGKNTVIVAQTGISGSTKIGKDCMIAGQVGMAGHLTIADGVKIAAQSGLGSNVKEKNAIIQGSPAFEVGKYRRAYVHFRNLHDIYTEMCKLRKELNDIKSEIKDTDS